MQTIDARLWTEFRNHYENSWAKTDSVLQTLCSQAPSHKNDADVYAKVYLIGRTYQSGIERHALVTPDKPGLDSIADLLLRDHATVDRIIRSVAELPSEPTRLSIRKACQAHAKFLKTLCQGTRNNAAPRSFASKYLHFHAVGVPIFDSLAERALRNIVGRQRRGDSDNEGTDPAYRTYSERLLKWMPFWSNAGLKPTTRNMDIYLLGWHKKYLATPDQGESRN